MKTVITGRMVEPISDNALVAAAQAFGKATEASAPNLYKQLLAALEAAAPYLIASQHAHAVTVDQCEPSDGWKCHPDDSRPPTGHVALWVPKAGEWLNSNDRRHRMAQAKITKAWREAAAEVAKGLPTFERPVRIIASVWKSRLGDYDAGNLYPTAKACVDGYRDAGLLIEDNNRYVIGPDMRHGGKGEPGIYFLITESV